MALALLDYYTRLLRDRDLALVQTAQPPDAATFYRLPAVPGLGKLLALVLRYAIHDLDRFPRGQACVSSGRLGTCAQASAGKWYGTSGPQMGNASLHGAFSEAAVLGLRAPPGGQQSLARVAKKPGKGPAFTGLAPKLARAVYDMFKRRMACEMPQGLTPS